MEGVGESSLPRRRSQENAGGQSGDVGSPVCPWFEAVDPRSKPGSPRSLASILALAELPVARRRGFNISPHCWIYKLRALTIPAMAYRMGSLAEGPAPTILRARMLRRRVLSWRSWWSVIPDPTITYPNPKRLFTNAWPVRRSMRGSRPHV